MTVRPVYCVAILTAVVLSSTLMLSIDMPLSLVYRLFHSDDAMRYKASTINSARYKMAVQHIRSLNRQVVTRPITSTSPSYALDIVVAVVTVARSNSISNGYLTQTVSAVDKVLKLDEAFRRKLLFICNVDEHPNNHAEAVQLQSKFHYVRKHGTNSLGIVTIRNKMINTKLVDKARIRETEDYVFCMNASYALNSKYVLILEDDVIPYRGMLDVLYHTLTFKLDPENSLLKKSRSNFAYLKLYYPLKWQGFAFEIDKLLESVCISVVCGTILSGLFFLFVIRCTRRKREVYSYTHLFIYGIVLCYLVIHIIGRVNIDEWRRCSPQLHRLELSSACCTQAMVYARQHIPKLMNHLLVNSSLNKDLAIYEFSQTHSLPGLQIEPNLFLHTGLSTSLSTEKKDPQEFLFG